MIKYLVAIWLPGMIIAGAAGFYIYAVFDVVAEMLQ